MSVIKIDMLCGCQWEPKNKRKQHCNKQRNRSLCCLLQLHAVKVVVLRLVSRMKRNQLRNKEETDITVCLAETD